MGTLQKSGAFAVAIITAVVLGNVYGVGTGVIALAGAVLLGVIFTLWVSLQNLTGEAPLSFEEALSLGAVTPEEEKKRAILRTLKDLEYERSVGKISDEDFKELSAQHRQEARQLLQQLDEGLAPARRRAEELLEERLHQLALPKAGSVAKASSEDTADLNAAEVNTTEIEAPTVAEATIASTTRSCSGCSGANDQDAQFCKHCGARLLGASESPKVAQTTEGSTG